MAALYFIHEIVEHSYEHADILDKVDLIFMPTANPGLRGLSNHKTEDFTGFFRWLRVLTRS